MTSGGNGPSQLGSAYLPTSTVSQSDELSSSSFKQRAHKLSWTLGSWTLDRLIEQTSRSAWAHPRTSQSRPLAELWRVTPMNYSIFLSPLVMIDASLLSTQVLLTACLAPGCHLSNSFLQDICILIFLFLLYHLSNHNIFPLVWNTHVIVALVYH